MKKILIFLAIGLSSGSCKKQLNVFPTTSEVDGNLITDEQSAQAALNGIYYRFANAGKDKNNNGNLTTFWSTVNEAIPSQLAGTLWNLSYGSPTISQFTPSYAYTDSIWNYGYSLVNAANGFLKNAAHAANIPSAAKNQMLAEARFLRAFGNSELLLYYGQYNDPASKYGIILRDTFVTSADINLPRSGVAAAYAAILSDLDMAVGSLPSLNVNIGYANVSDAKLLKARVLMNRGMAGDYDQVVRLTNDIITSGPFALEDSLKDIFLIKGFSSKEVMLGIQPYPNENFKYLTYQSSNQYLATDTLMSLLANDSRNHWMFRNAKLSNLVNPKIHLATKYYSGDPFNITQTPLSGYCYAFRLSEAYLLEAEAITLSTGDLATARALLMTVMRHAGAGAQEMAAVANAVTPAALQLEIVKENIRNFAYENGIDWFSLRRLPFGVIRQLNPLISDPTRLLLPIPNAELNSNSVFQNPGY